MTPLLNAEGPAVCTVAIAIPCQDQVAAGFAYDLARLIGYITLNQRAVHVLAYMNKGTLLVEQRHLLTRAALEQKATHILWLDADMRFPPNALERLLAHATPIVGCNYSTRRAPALPTAGRGTKDELLYAAPDATDLIEVDRMGMGCMLVQTAVYRAVPAPWYAIGFNRAQDGYAGEDVFFCRVAAEHGFKVLVDPVLSREIGHLGEFEHKLLHADVTKAHALAQQAAEPPKE